MFYALIVICLVGVGTCDVDHATFAEQSKPEFDDVDQCFDSARFRVMSSWKKVPVLAKRPMTDFNIDIYCTPAGAPA